MTFQLKHYRLPHPGIIPGAGGHKKVVVPPGTKVYCIVYGTKIYWCAYLDEAQALKCMAGLQCTIEPGHRRHITLSALLEWNFADRIPRRVCRPLASQEEGFPT